MTAARSPGRPAGRRKPFIALRKGLTEHVLSGRLTGSAFGVYVWLHLQADHRTGTLRTNAGRLAGELGMHAAKVRRDLAALRGCGYIRYDSEPGSRELYVITIEKYDRHFERPEAGAEPVAVHVEGHVRRTRSGTGAPRKCAWRQRKSGP